MARAIIVPVLKESEEKLIKLIQNMNEELKDFYKIELNGMYKYLIEFYCKDIYYNHETTNQVDEDKEIINKIIDKETTLVEYEKIIKYSTENNIALLSIVTYIIDQFVDNPIFIKKNMNKCFSKNGKATNIPVIISFPLEVLNHNLSELEKEQVKITVYNSFEENGQLSNLMKDCGGILYVFENIYKMNFIFKYTSGEIGECFLNRGSTSVQKWIKKLGWELDKFEVQQRIVDRGRRDYKEIRNKSKNTMLKNSVNGSVPEEYTRQFANTYLPIQFPDYEVIVGLNNVSILNEGKEIDIPIIIITNENKIFKYAIEYNGSYWHRDTERDEIKEKFIIEKGYKLFSIAPKKNASPKQINEHIEERIKEICNFVREDIIVE